MHYLITSMLCICVCAEPVSGKLIWEQPTWTKGRSPVIWQDHFQKANLGWQDPFSESQSGRNGVPWMNQWCDSQNKKLSDKHVQPWTKWLSLQWKLNTPPVNDEKLYYENWEAQNSISLFPSEVLSGKKKIAGHARSHLFSTLPEAALTSPIA